MNLVSKKQKQHSNPQKPCNPWFNEKCKAARKRAADYAKIHDLTTPNHKLAYNGLRQEYKRVIQAEKRKYLLAAGETLDNLITTSPNEFWKYLKSLQHSNKKACNQITLQDFHQYFESQNMVPVQQYFDQGHMHKIEEAMRIYECTEANPGEVASDVLDSPITILEIN